MSCVHGVYVTGLPRQLLVHVVESAVRSLFQPERFTRLPAWWVVMVAMPGTVEHATRAEELNAGKMCACKINR